jgi:succinyl-diaminopimelate desuccinylase
MPTRKELIEKVDEVQEEAVEFLQKLVQTPSINPPGEYEAITKLIADRFEQLGLEAQTVRVPRETVSEAGLETPRINVLGWLRGSVGRPVLVLNPHLDTVPVGANWTMDPFKAEIKNGKLYGRGASDSKGRIAAYTYALGVLKRAGISLKGTAVVAATVDEETGGELGPKYLLDAGYLDPDMAIVEGSTHTIWNAMNGCLHLEIKVLGRSAHAATPERGVDAIERMNHVMSALYRYRDTLHSKKSAVRGIQSPTLVVGTIAGGAKTNVVPELCTVTLDRRIIPEEKGEEVEKELLALLRGLEKEDPELNLRVRRVMLAESYGPLPEDHFLIQTIVRNATEVLGEKPVVEGLAGFGDSRFYWARGIPVCNFGPSPKIIWESNAHGADENIVLDDLFKSIRILVLTMIDLLGE